MSSVCWCGNGALQVFSADYFRCARCETLVAARMPKPKDLFAGEDDQGFYGRSYFESYQAEHLGLPPIAERARHDLPERCVHWLRALLRYKLPPARVLELGSAHGGFVALMRWAGYDAAGLELSPWVADFARKTFDVPMLQGTIEEQPAEPQSLDALVLMDVLEHLPDPLGTLQHCVSRLKSDGILLIQTPSYREGMSLAEMTAAGDAFVKMLLPEQHLFLFSKRSVAELLRRAGAGDVRFEPAIFAAYDMFLVGTMAPLPVIPEEQIQAALSASPNSRLVGALSDLRSSYTDLAARFAESEADRADRMRVIGEQGQRLAELDAVIRPLMGQVETQQALLAASEADRPANIEELQRLLAESQPDRADRLRKTEALDGLRREPAARLISAEARADDSPARADRLEAPVDEREGREHPVDAELVAKQRALEGSRQDLSVTRETFERLQTSYVYRFLRGLGLWGWLARGMAGVDLGETVYGKRPRTRPLERVVVDLTPVLSGGENGGAKVMTMELLRQFQRLGRGCEFVLLTSPASHDELAFLDSVNMQRHCVQAPAPTFPLRVFRWLGRFLPAAVIRRARSLYRAAAPASNSLLRQLKADVLFCPFTAPFFSDPRVPAVAVIYDLQHVYHPYFFNAHDRDERERSFRDACTAASKLVCISDYVRRTVLDNAALSADRVETIKISVPQRLAEPSPVEKQRVLDQFELEAGAYLIYPANFWPHKNHEILLTAFGMYHAHHPESKLKLVLTGTPGKRQDYIREAAGRMGLSRVVVFGGYLPDSEFAALLWSSLALIFPSLYEGFGMPVLEAMAARKPVLCSNAASLPEIAGDAAILFDPRKPDEIADAIARLADDPEYASELADRGCERVGFFGGPEEMASRYLRIFQEVAVRPALSASRVHGVYSDGWAAGHLVVAYGEGPAARRLMVELSAPEWAPTSPSMVRVLPAAAGLKEAYSLSRGETVTVERTLPSGSGIVEIEVQPEFQPVACGVGGDTRWIGCRFVSARILSEDGTLTALESDGRGV